MSWFRLISAFVFTPCLISLTIFFVMVSFGWPDAVWFVQCSCLMAYSATVFIWWPLYFFYLRHNPDPRLEAYVIAGMGTGAVMGFIPFVMPLLAAMKNYDGFGFSDFWLMFSGSIDFFALGIVYAGLSGAVFWVIAFYQRQK